MKITGCGTGAVTSVCKPSREYLASLVLILGLVVGAGSLQAADIIPLSSEDAERLGLEFSSVVAMDSRSGTRVPATVINSPEANSALRALYGGFLQSWQVLPGATVTEGQPLATVKSQDILAVQDQWLAANSQLKQADFNLSRDEQLFADGIIARQRLVETRAAHQQLAFAEQAARLRLTRAGFDQAQLKQLAASGEGAGIYYLRAPRDAVLAKRHVMSGERIDQDAIVADLSGGVLWASADVPVQLAVQLEIGQALSLEQSISHDQSLSYKKSGASLILREKARTVDPASQTVAIRAEFQSDIQQMPGQVVSLVIPPAEGGVLVPASAVVHNGSDTLVFVRIPEGVEVRLLNLTPVGSDYVARTGLSVGDEVVTRGAAILKGIQLGLGGE